MIGLMLYYFNTFTEIISKKMKRLSLFLFLFLGIAAFELCAQDSIIYYNGKSFTGKISGYNNSSTVFSLEMQKKNRIKLKTVDKANVFAVFYHDSSGKILYEPDITIEDDLTIAEMESFIAGQHLARYRYHAPWATACGVVSGLGGVYLGFWGFAVPAVYVGVVTAVPVKPVKKKYFPADRVNDEAFIEGFKYQAKRKKMVNSLIGGGIGLLTLGTVLAILTNVYYID